MYDAPKLNLSKSNAEFEHGKKCTPGGVLGIRRPYNFVEGEYPIYFESGKGGRITDIDGNEYIDYLCAYGPIIIGHREEEVDNAVIDQMRNKGFCFSLTQSIQNRLADKLKSLIRCAEMSVFVKTGSDATTLATRVARGYTGRNKIMRCGYHGWHDWCVEVKGGVPAKLYEDVYEFHYNHLEQLEELMKQHGDQTAAIIITPIGHPLAEQVEYPKPGFLEGVRALADKYGAVLIFDEIRTGFRVNLGGAQTLLGVTPDLSTFGKAMANGYPIGACVGKTQFMKKIEKEVFISSTFFPNSLEFAAALKTLEIMERDDILGVIKKKGEWFNAELNKVLAKHKVSASTSLVPQMPFIHFNKDEAKTYKAKRVDFYTQLIRRKVFLQPYHHGYIAYRHTDEDLKLTIKAIDEALCYVDEKEILRNSKMEKLIITAAICGAEVTKENNPAVPYTIAELVREAESAINAGASIIHLHVRDDNGTPTQSRERFKAAMDAIRERCPKAIIQPSTGGAVGMSNEERLQPVDLKPEMATLDCGTVNFGNDDIFVNSENTIIAFGKKMLELGVKPEVEVFDKGMIDTAIRLQKKGFIASPMHFNFVMGVTGGISATVRDVVYMHGSIPAGSTFTVSGIGRAQFQMATTAILLGGHVRVGFEDNTYLAKGLLAASNGEMVAKAVRIAKELGREIATPDEARAILGLRAR